MILHAGCAALRIGGLWRGVLITGPSGAGKSDLKLRLLQQGWRIVADDRTLLWTDGGVLFARAPEALVGLLEAREFDVVTVPALRLARVVLELDCGQEPERLPDLRTTERSGLPLRTLRLPPLHASTPAKLRSALFAAVRQAPLDSAPQRRI